MVSHAKREGRWTSLAGRWLLALTVMGSALAVGTVHTIPLCIFTAAAGASAALLWAHREVGGLRSVAVVLIALGLGLIAYTALQCVPMPATWLKVIAPHNADVWARALLPLHESGPTWAPLSLDPIATRIQLVRGVAYLFVFLAALEVARSKEGVHFLAVAIVASGVVVTLAALLHPAFEQSKVFGLYTPHREIAPRHIAPLLNANHLSAYANIALCCAVAMALDTRLERARILPGAVALMLAGIQLWIASRGGVVAMALGVLIVILVRILRPRSSAATPILLGVVAAGGVGMAVFGQWNEAWVELASTDTSKLTLFRQTFPMIRDHAIFGVGRGAFESTFPEYRLGNGYLVFTHPENLVLQWATEWGVPITLAAITTLLVVLRPGVADTRGKWAIGAWAAVIAVGLHNLVDFSSETPAVVFALACCVAIVVGGVRQPRRERESSVSIPRWSVAIATPIAVLLGISTLGRDLESDREALASAREDASARFPSILRAAILRHPAEPYLPYVGALHATSIGESVIPWIGRVLERAPVYGSAHLLLARELGARHPAQARLEDKLGIEQMDLTATTQSVVQAAVGARLIGSYEDALELAPEGPQRPVALIILSDRLGKRLPATAYRLDDLLLAFPQPPSYVIHHRADEALSDLRAREAAPWCDIDRPACVSAALQAVERFEAAEPTCDAHALEANVRIEGGAQQEAFVHLKTFTKSVPQTGACLVQVAQVALAANLPDEATHAVDEMAHLPCANQDECVSNLVWAATIETGRGYARRALAFYQKAFDVAPERDDLASLVADQSLALAMYSEALVAYQRLALHHPDEPKYRDGVAKANDGVLRYRELNSVPR